MFKICCFEHIICFNAANKQAFLWKNLLINAAFGMFSIFLTPTNAAFRT